MQNMFSQIMPVLENQNAIIQRLAPLTTLLPTEKTSTPRRDTERSTRSRAAANTTYDAEEEDNCSDFDNTPISRAKRSRGDQDNIFHVMVKLITSFCSNEIFRVVSETT